MRIAFFYLGQFGAGAALDTLEMAIGLSTKAEVLCIVSSKANNYHVWKEKSTGNPNLNVYGVETTKNPIKGILEVLNIGKFRKIRKTIDKFAPDVVFSHMGHPWERLIIPYLNCKVVAKGVHDVNFHAGENTLQARLVKRLFSFNTPFKVVFSDFSKQELIKQGMESDRILTTQLGCNSIMVKNEKPDMTWHGKFLFFGRLIKYKGIDVLMKSLDNVFSSHPKERLVIAGRGDLSEYDDIIEKYHDNLEIHDCFIPDNEVEEYFRDVDFVVAPYTNATQSGVVLLAYSFGRPVIASNSGGLPEQVKEGITGMIVPSGDALKLADAINYLIEHPESTHKMKEAAFECSHQMTWDESAAILYEQFNKIVNIQNGQDKKYN